jgi:hypothetical protein
MLVVCAVAASAAYAGKDVFNSGTYSATVTAQNYAVSPFPMSLEVKGKNGKRTKEITGLTIGPITMDCLSNAGQVSEPVTLAALTGFPAIKSDGFFIATFLYKSGHWTKVSDSTVQTADPEVSIDMVQDSTKPPTFNSNGGSEPGMSIVVQANVSGSTATVAQGGTSTCNIDNSNPTLTLH